MRADLPLPPLGEGWDGGQRRLNTPCLFQGCAAPIPAFPQRGKEWNAAEQPA
jgi:hypothetical protein